MDRKDAACEDTAGNYRSRQNINRIRVSKELALKHVCFAGSYFFVHVNEVFLLIIFFS